MTSPNPTGGARGADAQTRHRRVTPCRTGSARSGTGGAVGACGALQAEKLTGIALVPDDQSQTHSNKRGNSRNTTLKVRTVR